MKFIEVEVKTAKIIHGFDDQSREIVEELKEKKYVKKILSVERIMSVSEDYILVTSSHQRVVYWEYKGGLENIRKKLTAAGLLLI